ncbi:MAG: MMPL family transporter, partial [Pseudomonadales bacterium]|nr:MMPL family transporter [Pseudomonadales bacterium]
LIFVVMFFGLGIDFAVHFVLKAMEEDEGGTVGAVRDIGPALMLCMLTSIIAFLSFTPTAYVGLAELGVISAEGMTIAFLLTITLIPAMFQVFGAPPLRHEPARHWHLELPPLPVLGVAGLLTIGAVYMARNASFDYSVLAMRDNTTEGMSTLIDLQRDAQTTDYSIYVIAHDESEAKELKRALSRLPEVGSVNVPSDYIPGDQLEKSALMSSALDLYGEIEEVAPGDSRDNLDAAIAYLVDSANDISSDDKAVYNHVVQVARAFQKDPAALARADAALGASLRGELARIRTLLSAAPFTFDDAPQGLRSRLETDKGELLMTVQPSSLLTSRAATEQFIKAVSAVAPNIAGRSVVEWGVGEVVVQSFIFAGTATFIIIFVLLVAYFRSLRLPVMVLTPIALAALFTLAPCQVTSLSLNMANVLVVPLIIGLGVDAGIHVVHRFVNAGSVDGIYRSSTSRAVVISALTTIGTFFSLSFSPHKGAASVGLLLTIAISLMLVCTFVVLPALLSTFAAKPGRKR